MSCQALYDFDGTLTSKDTTIILLTELVKLRPWRVLGVGWYLLRMRLARRSEIKQNNKNKAIGFLIRSLGDNQISSAIDSFRSKVKSLYRRTVLKSVEQVIQEGGTVLIVTASPSFAIQGCFSAASIFVIGTEFEKVQGIYTGRLQGRNCYGLEKVNRIYHWAESSGQALNVQSAWGDHPSDFEMLSLSAKRYWVVEKKLYEQILSRDPDAKLLEAD